MRSTILSAALLLGMAVAVLGAGAAADTACDMSTVGGSKWLATGHITKVEGRMLYFLGQDNKVYKINTSTAVVVNDATGQAGPKLATGDKVRVYGVVAGPCSVKAVRIRQFGPPRTAAGVGEKMVKIIIEKPPAPAEYAAGPHAAARTARVPDWEGQGLVGSINYDARQIGLLTSTGQFTVNTAGAAFGNGVSRIGLGRINIGDTVRIAGVLSGLNTVDALRVSVLRTRSDAENALPVTPASIVGVIQQVDYQSLTFKMQGQSTVVVVAADPNTIVQEAHHRMAFMDLRPGMRVKVSGYGSLGTGFSAQHIMIISVSP